MSYTIKNNRNQTVTVIPDRHIDSTATSLSLIGFNVSDYGLGHNENFISLLENFANDTAPTNPMEGQLWYDTQHNEMKLYSFGTWKPLGNGAPSVGGDSGQNGLGGIYHYAVTSPATSILIYFAGGEAVMIMSPINLTQGQLPANVTIDGVSYPISARFPYGVVAGTTMAEDSANFQYMGEVALSEQSYFAGGGDNHKPAGWTYVDLGTNTVGFMVSNGFIICAVSQATIAASSLPTTISVQVRLSDHSIETTNLTCRSVFSGGLFPGLTFSTGFSLGGFITLSMLNQNLASQYATITQEYKAWADDLGSTAQAVNTLTSKFTTAAGTSSFSQAIDYVLAQSTDTGATAAAIQTLHTEFQTALGTSSWADSLTKLTSISTDTTANSQDLTALHSAFQASTGQSNFANAISTLWTEATSTGSVSGWSLNLDTNGYVIGVEALNGGASHNYFKVTSSDFIIGDNNIDFVPFEVRSGVVYIKNAAIENLTIGTDKITNWAITNGSSAISSSGQTIANGSQNFPITITPNINSASSIVRVSCSLNMDASDDIGADVYLVKTNGTSTITLQRGKIVLKGASGNSAASLVLNCIDSSPSAGNLYTYKILVQNNTSTYGGTGSSFTVLAGAYLDVVETKK